MNKVLLVTAAKNHWGRWLDKILFSILATFCRGTTKLLRTPQRFLAANVGTNAKKQNRNMKSIFIFFLCILYLTGQGQELKTLKEAGLGKIDDKQLSLGQEWSVAIKPDSKWIFHVIEFEKNDKIQLTDSVDLTAYGFNFRLLELNGKGNFVFIIEAIYEFVSYYPVYIINQEEIKKIGFLNIRLDCNDCDALNYPLNKIKVQGNNERIEFSFKQDLVLMDKDDFPKYNKNEILFVYDFEKEKMRIITSKGANKQ